MLSDREKFILHLVSMMTITRLSDTEHPEQLICKMMEDVRRNRCRSIAPEDVGDVIEEVNDEMLAGGIMFNELMADAVWTMTGERPNKNTDWSDMK